MIIDQCRKLALRAPARVVFPDALDVRVLKAAHYLQQQGLAHPILVASQMCIRDREYIATRPPAIQPMGMVTMPASTPSASQRRSVGSIMPSATGMENTCLLYTSRQQAAVALVADALCTYHRLRFFQHRAHRQQQIIPQDLTHGRLMKGIRMLAKGGQRLLDKPPQRGLMRLADRQR